MLESLRLNKNALIYFDEGNHTIARMPTKSNLLDISSDNSLYFGVIDNENSVKTLCLIFNLKKIKDFHGKKYEMSGYGITCEVTLNVSKQNQLQIRVGKDPVMHDLFNAYLLRITQSLTNKEVVIVLDFKHKEIRFKRIKDMEL